LLSARTCLRAARTDRGEVPRTLAGGNRRLEAGSCSSGGCRVATLRSWKPRNRGNHVGFDESGVSVGGRVEGGDRFFHRRSGVGGRASGPVARHPRQGKK